MSLLLVILVTLLYVGVAVSEFFRSRYGFAGVFVGYALANIGLMYAMYVGE